MRHVGLLGGMSWQSSALYYRLLNEGVQERLGGLHSASCTMRSVDFAEIEALQSSGAWDDAGRLLAEEARQLELAGADVLVLCTNTMHPGRVSQLTAASGRPRIPADCVIVSCRTTGYAALLFLVSRARMPPGPLARVERHGLVADTIEAGVTIPLLHIGDVTAQAVHRAGVGTVALLGTAFTMEQPFLRDRLARHDLDVLVPDASERADVHRVIYDELVLGQVREESRGRFAEIIGRLADDGAQGVILGCTEIELLVTQDDSPVPLFPTTRLHAEAAVAHALQDH